MKTYKTYYECYSNDEDVLRELLGCDLSSPTLEEAIERAESVFDTIRIKMRYNRYFRWDMERKLPVEIFISEMVYEYDEDEDKEGEYPVSDEIVKYIRFDGDFM